jgi:hypothetical protein
VVRVTADIVADGKPREAQLTLRLVRYQGQALRVAEINRRLGRLWGRATVKLGPRFCELEDGDWVAMAVRRYFGGATRTFRIEAYSIDEKWQNTLTLREIAATCSTTTAFSRSTAACRSRPRRRPTSARRTPAIGRWRRRRSSAPAPACRRWRSPAARATTTRRKRSSSNIGRATESPTRRRPRRDPLDQRRRYPPDTTKIDITSLAGLGTYYVALRYVVSGIPGDRLVMGPVTIGDLDVGGQVIIDGFDMYNGTGTNTGLQAKWTVASTGNLTLQTGRFSGQCLRTADSGTQGLPLRTLTSAIANIGVGVAVRASTMPTTNNVGSSIVALRNGATYTFGLRITTTGALEAYRLTSATAGTSLGVSAAGVIVANTWHFVEVGVVINDTTGSVVVKVDGVTVLNLTAQDTNNAVTNVDTIVLGHTQGSSSNSGVIDLDDLYVVDSATTLGERRVETLRPSADTATKNWTPNSGTNNYDRVNESTVDGDTTYVQASTVGTRDLYSIGSLSSTPANIDAIQVVSFGEKTDATSRSIYNSIQSNSVDSDGSSFALAASYGKFERIVANDPSGGGAWTATRVNNLLIGPKIAA